MKTQNMTFSEALEAMKNGYKVRREEWEDYKMYYYIEESEIKDISSNCVAVISHTAIMATDWQIYTNFKPEPHFEIGELVMMKKEDYDKWYPKFFAKREDGWDGTRYCAISEITLYKQCAKFDKDIVFTNKPAKQ